MCPSTPLRRSGLSSWTQAERLSVSSSLIRRCLSLRSCVRSVRTYTTSNFTNHQRTPESQGVVERFHQTLQGQTRTLCHQLKEKVNIDIESTSTLLPWISKHASWLISRYLAHSSDKLASYARRFSSPFAHLGSLCTSRSVLLGMPSSSRLGFRASGWARIPPRMIMWLGPAAERLSG